MCFGIKFSKIKEESKEKETIQESVGINKCNEKKLQVLTSRQMTYGG